jgi:TatD DNase family protein
MDREGILTSMREKSVATIVIGTDILESEKAVILADTEGNVWASVGLHPADNIYEEFNYELYKNLAEHKKVVAIGECGLDYFYIEKFFEADKEKSEKINWNKDAEQDRQQNIFIEHIRLASEMDLPLMLHIRDVEGSLSAYEDAIQIIKNAKEKYQNIRGNVHFFASTTDIAKQFVDLGFTVSFTGVITFAHDYDEVIKSLPIESLHAETDSPYVTPNPVRGTVNNPNNVIYVVNKLAELRGENEDKMAEMLMENAKRLYKFN